MKKLLAALLVTFLAAVLLLNFDEKLADLINPLGRGSESLGIILVTTGDIGLVRDINYQIIQRSDPTFPFKNIASYLRDSDLTIANLEGPLIKNCPIIREGFVLCGKDSNVSGLVSAGIDAVSVANNHSTNFGMNGLQETVDVIESNNIVPFGLNGEIEYLTIKNKKIALVGFVELGSNWGGLNNATDENVSTLISAARQNADIVITTFHWGNEYTYNPSENQNRLGHLAIDLGADIVLGKHPH